MTDKQDIDWESLIDSWFRAAEYERYLLSLDRPLTPEEVEWAEKRVKWHRTMDGMKEERKRRSWEKEIRIRHEAGLPMLTLEELMEEKRKHDQWVKKMEEEENAEPHIVVKLGFAAFLAFLVYAAIVA